MHFHISLEVFSVCEENLINYTQRFRTDDNGKCAMLLPCFMLSLFQMLLPFPFLYFHTTFYIDACSGLFKQFW